MSADPKLVQLLETRAHKLAPMCSKMIIILVLGIQASSFCWRACYRPLLTCFLLPLTTVRQHPLDIGQNKWRNSLLDFIEGRQEHQLTVQPVVFATKLTVRKSCRAEEKLEKTAGLERVATEEG